MVTLKIPYAPDAQSYTASPPKEAVREVQLSGGKAYQRRGLLNGTWNTTVQFTCDRDRYDILSGFYTLWEENPQRFFEVPLILNDAEVQNYQARFVAGTFKLASQSGHTYVVTASLEVKPKKASGSANDLNAARAIFVSIYGSEREGKKVAMDPLWEMINVIMPVKESDHVH